jgi:hypothetical protein
MKRRTGINSAKIFVAALTVFSASAVTCSARLAETFEECQARYGLLVKVENGSRADYPQYCFQKDGIEIRIRFLNAHSGQEIFTGSAGAMSDLAIADILNANGQGSTWSSTTVGHARVYIRADNKAIAQYTRRKDGRGHASLTLETTEFKQTFQAPGTGF